MSASATPYDQRPRFKANCLPCRRRKSKCDRVQPCSPCVMRETAHDCYAGQEPPPPENRVYAPPAASTSDVKLSAHTQAPSRPTTATSATSSPPSKRVRMTTNVDDDADADDDDNVSPAALASDPRRAAPSSAHSLRTSLERLQGVLGESLTKLRETEVLLAKTQVALDEEPRRRRAREEERPREVDWESLQDILPGETECWLLIDVFFSDLDWFITIVYRPWFMNAIWNGGLRRGASITLSQGALLCVMLALAALLAPSTHTAKRMIELEEDQRNHLVDHAIYLLDCEDQTAEGWSAPICKPPTTTRLQVELLVCHYLLNAGHIERSYLRLGGCIRRAKQIGLFDGRSREWRVNSERTDLLANFSHDEQQKIDESEEGGVERPSEVREAEAELSLPDPPEAISLEMHRRLGWDLIILDWWQNLQWSRPPDINQADIYLDLPSYLVDGQYRLAAEGTASSSPSTTNRAAPSPHSSSHTSTQPAVPPPQPPKRIAFWGNYIARIKLTQILPSVVHFMSAMTLVAPSVRYEQARKIDQLFTRWVNDHGHSLDEVEQSVKTGGPEAHRLAAQKVINHSACGFLRCLMHKCFLSDKNAPEDLKFRALVHARSIMETMPLLIALSASPHVLFNPSWCAEHLFHAATAFAFVLLTREETSPLGSRRGSSDLTKASPTSAFLRTESQSQSEQPNDLLWFATHVSEIIHTLRSLGSSSQTASVCERILSRLCDSKKNLKMTMQRLNDQRARAAQGVGPWQIRSLAGRERSETGGRSSGQSSRSDEHRHQRQQSHHAPTQSPPMPLPPPPSQSQDGETHGNAGRMQWSVPSAGMPGMANGLAEVAAMPGRRANAAAPVGGYSAMLPSPSAQQRQPFHLQPPMAHASSSTVYDPTRGSVPGSSAPFPPLFTPTWDARVPTPADLDTFSWLFLQEMDWAEMLRDPVNSRSGGGVG